MTIEDKELLRCENPECRMPLAKRQGGKLSILRDQGRDKIGVNVEVPWDNGGSYRLQCGKCGRSKIFISLVETINIQDEAVDVKLK